MTEKRISIARYCSIESRYCERLVALQPFPSCFVAYPSGQHWREFSSELQIGLKSRGIVATRWQDTVGNSVLFTKICESIHGHTFMLCDLTEMNLNVLFEVGYALGCGRDVVIAVDTTRERPEFKLLKVKDQCLYATRDDIYAWLDGYVAHYSSQPHSPVSPSLLTMNGINEAAERPGTLYYLRPEPTNQVIKAVQDQLSQSFFNVVSADPYDPTYDDFYSQARRIKESQLVVGLITTNRTLSASLVNGPVLLMLGFAIGLGKRVLVLYEQPNETILDLGTVLKPFQGEATAKSIVKQWLGEQSKELLQAGNTEQPSVRRKSDLNRIRDLFLGSPDATADYDLMRYFIQSPEYRYARNGVKQLFIGRKGAGKSANFRVLRDELGRRRGSIVVSIAPTDFQFEQLTGFLEDRYSVLHPALVYQTFWRYIIFTEVLKVMRERYDQFMQSPVPEHVRRLYDFIAEHDSVLELDFASRAISTLEELQRLPRKMSNSESEEALKKVLLQARLGRIEQDLKSVAKQYPIHILVDDVDKHWNPSYPASVSLLLGLVNEAAKLQGAFKDSLHVVLFLRQDIFQVLQAQDEELVKRSVAELRWSESALLNMIAERVRFHTGTALEVDEEVWATVLPAIVSGEMGWHYLVHRSLMRPRDVLHFCQLAIERAQANKHLTVVEADVLEAEEDYSYYMLKALRLEYLHLCPRIDEVAFEFAERKSRTPLAEVVAFVEKSIFGGTLGDLEWVRSCNGDPFCLIGTLYSVGFCGLGSSARGQVYYSHARPWEEAKALCQQEPEVVVHPAFHRALEIVP